MNNYKKYQQQSTVPRVDIILALYDSLINNLERVQTLPRDEATALLARCKLAISGMVAGVAASPDPAGQSFLRLYEYVHHCLDQGTSLDLKNALDILRILREGFQHVRPQALDLERQGHLPPANHGHTLRALA